MSAAHSGRSSGDPAGAPGIAQPQAGPASLENHLGGAEGARYRKYQYDLIEPYVGRSMLELGSGLGDFSEQFLNRLDYLAVSDNDAYCLAELASRYAARTDVEVLELALPCEIKIRRQVDTVVMMNVLEHVNDDVSALRDLAACVEVGGHLVIWVPGYQRLYGDFDRLVGHCRRYSPVTLRAAVEAAGLTVRVCRPVNFLGGLAWWLAVRRLGVGHASGGLVSLYDATVVPATRLLERVFHPPFGQSVLCVATVPHD